MLFDINQAPADRIIELSRIIDAPLALVFSAWTDVKHLNQWWGPKGFSVETIESDLRVGGRWRFTMTGPDGTLFPNRITYREIVSRERIVYDHDSDSDAEDAQRFSVVVTFQDLAGKTKVTMQTVFPTAAAREFVVGFGAIELGKTTLDKLATHARELEHASFAPGEIRLERTFRAPAPFVFDAFTKPEHFAAWFGPHDCSLPVCELDPRPGGKIRFVHQVPGMPPLWLHGEYVELDAPSHIVFDLRFTDESGASKAPAFLPEWPVEAMIRTIVTLHHQDGHTTVRLQQVVTPASAAQSPIVRTERRLAREGWSETLDRLGALVEKLG